MKLDTLFLLTCSLAMGALSVALGKPPTDSSGAAQALGAISAVCTVAFVVIAFAEADE